MRPSYQQTMRPSYQQAMNNLRAALFHCHLKKRTVSPFDVEMVLYDIEQLTKSLPPTTSNLSKEGIVRAITIERYEPEQLKPIIHNGQEAQNQGGK